MIKIIIAAFERRKAERKDKRKLVEGILGTQT